MSIFGRRFDPQSALFFFFFGVPFFHVFFLFVAAVCGFTTEYPFFFPSLFFIFAFLVLLPLSRNANPGSHSRQALLPPPQCGTCPAFLSREGFSTLFPLRLASNCAYPRYNWRSRRLVSFEDKKLHTEIRTHSINARLSGVRG